MGLFGSAEDREAKNEEKINKMMAKYGLENLSPEYAEKVKVIQSELLGIGLMETGMKLSMAKAEEQMKVSYLHAIYEQNWMIIRLLNDIAKK